MMPARAEAYAEPGPLLATGVAVPLPDAAGSLVWIDRREDARTVLEFLGAAGRLAVLYGKRGIGKTELVRRWVLPRLADRPGFYVDCRRPLADQVGDAGSGCDLWSGARAGGIVFVDSAEELLHAVTREQEEFLRAAQAFVRDAGSRATLVLIVDENRLRELFALRERFPEILDHTLEIAGVDVRQRSAPRAPALAAEAADELEQKSGGVSPELLRIVETRQRRPPPPSAEQFVGPGEADGGPLQLRAVLWDHLRERLEAISIDGLSAKASFEVGFELLAAVIAGGGTPAPPALTELAERTGATEGQCLKLLGELEGPGGLLRRGLGGKLTPVPIELTEAVTAEVERRQVDARDVERMIDQGVRDWRARRPLPTRRVFALVHRHRRSLRLSPEQLALVVYCALLYDDKDDLQATRYWLRRLGERSADLLLSALFHRTAAVRRRAAQLLGDLPQPAVRDQLHILALRDGDAAVRQSAKASLAGMKSEELRDRLQAEVRDPASPYRATALETLAIFRDAATVIFLRQLLATPGFVPDLRRAAIRVLGELEIDEAVDLLLELGLTGKGEDARAAADSLGALQSAPLQERVFAALRGAERGARREGPIPGRQAAPSFVGQLAVAAFVVFANNVIHGSFLLLKGRRRAGGAILALQAAGLAGVLTDLAWGPGFLLLATWTASQWGALRVALDERRQDRSPASSLPGLVGALSVLSVAVNPVFWVFHGLAHAAARRLRRAVVLLALELGGALLMATIAALEVPEIGGASPLSDRLLAITLYAYFGLGVALLAGSFLYDVAAILFTEVLRGSSRELSARRRTIYARLLQNRAATGRVIVALRSADRGEAKWARDLVRSYGEELDPRALLDQLPEQLPAVPPLFLEALARSKTEATVGALAAAWKEASPAARDAIVTLLGRHPTQASIEALAGLSRSLSWHQRWRAGLGSWQFRFRVWPRTALAAILLALPLVAVFCGESVQANLHPYLRDLRFIEKQSNEAEPRIATARFLATVYPAEAEATLAALLRSSRTAPEVRKGLAASLADVARNFKPASGEEERRLDRARKDALKTLLKASRRDSDPAVRQAALESLSALADGSADSPALYGLLQSRPVVHVLSEKILENPAEELAVRRLALSALAALRTGAIDALTRFVASDLAEPAGETPGGVVSAAVQSEIDLRQEAIGELYRMGLPEAVHALRGLAQAPILQPLQQAAQDAAELDPLWRVRDDLEHGRWQRAKDAADQFLAAPEREALAPRKEVLALRAKAEYGLAHPDSFLRLPAPRE